MAVDAAQKICDNLNLLKNEIKLLAQEINVLSKCKNDHESRVRAIETTCVTKFELSKLIDKLEAIQADITDLKVQGGINNTKLIIIVSLGSIAAAGIVTFVFQIIYSMMTN